MVDETRRRNTSSATAGIWLRLEGEPPSRGCITPNPVSPESCSHRLSGGIERIAARGASRDCGSFPAPDRPRQNFPAEPVPIKREIAPVRASAKTVVAQLHEELLYVRPESWRSAGRGFWIVLDHRGSGGRPGGRGLVRPQGRRNDNVLKKFYRRSTHPYR